jgi:very-short-patch-repair endonuclease
MNKRLLKFAKSMRHQPTDAEAALWKHLRAGRFSGFKFKRQQLIEHYIVDFVCLEQRLVIEVDGGQHDANVDGARTQWLEDHGFRILRLWNDEVLGREEAVLTAILNALRAPPLPNPSPARGEGLKISAGLNDCEI